MARRMTATEKWGDAWFCGLDPIQKLIWIYLVDTCDHAGIWEINMPLLRFHTGFAGTLNDLLMAFNAGSEGPRLESLNENKLFLTRFIRFQYPGGLDQNNAAHRGVLKRLEQFGMSPLAGAREGLPSPSVGLKDKEKDKDKEKEKEKNREAIKFQDGNLLVPVALLEHFHSEFGVALVNSELRKMVSWLKVNKPKKDYNRFVWNWLSKAKEQEPARPANVQDSRMIMVESKEDFGGFQTFLSQNGKPAVDIRVLKNDQGEPERWQFVGAGIPALFAKYKKEGRR